VPNSDRVRRETVELLGHTRHMLGKKKSALELLTEALKLRTIGLTSQNAASVARHLDTLTFFLCRRNDYASAEGAVFGKKPLSLPGGFGALQSDVRQSARLLRPSEGDLDEHPRSRPAPSSGGRRPDRVSRHRVARRADPRIELVTPQEHTILGGSMIAVHGSHLDAATRVTINGGELDPLVTTHASRLLGRVPPNAAGTYDLVVHFPGGDTVTAADTVTYVVPRIPPVEDLNCSSGEDCATEISWTNTVAYERLTVIRDGWETLAELPGDATRFTDPDNRCAGSTGTRYDIVGAVGETESWAANCSIQEVFRPAQHVFIGMHRASARRIDLRGAGTTTARSFFRLPSPASAGLLLQTFVAKLQDGASLRARIRHIESPHAIVVDSIPFPETGGSGRGRWLSTTGGEPGPSGDWLVEFFAAGGRPDRPYFSIALDESEEDLGAPYPCPPYPLVKAFSLPTSAPPRIDGVRRLPLAPVSFDLLNEAAGGAGNGQDAATSDNTVTLQVDAIGALGAIAGYEWDFGDGIRALTSSSIVTHQFTADGTQAVTVTARDHAGVEHMYATEVQIVSHWLDGACLDASPPVIDAMYPNPESELFVPGYPHTVPFRVRVKAACDQGIRSVVFLLPGRDVSFPAESGPREPDGTTYWTARVNLGLLPPTLTQGLLRVEAEDTRGRTASEDFQLRLCSLPTILDNSVVGTNVVYDINSKSYTVDVTVPPDFLYDYDLELPFVGTLENRVGAFIGTRFTLQNGRWNAYNLHGEMAATILDFDVFSRTWDWPNSAPSVPGCSDLVGLWSAEDLPVYMGWFEREVFDQTVFEDWVGPVHLRVGVALDIGLDASLFADLTARLERNDSSVELGIRPTLAGWAEGRIRADVYWGLASAELSLIPSVTLALPIDMRVPGRGGRPIDVDVDACWRIAVDVRGKACVDYWWDEKCWSTPTYNVIDYQHPRNCAANAIRQGAVAGVGVSPDTGLRSPSLAVSPDGSTRMTCFIDDVGDETFYDPEVFYSIDTGAGWSEPEPMFGTPDRQFQRDVRVVFLNDRWAIAVWTQNRLNSTQAARALAAAADGVEYANEVLGSTEIAYAYFNVDDGWQPVRYLTDDAFADGSPQIAPGSGGEAAITWVKSLARDVLDPAGSVRLSSTAVMAATVNISGRQDVFTISTESAQNRAADLEPTVAIPGDPSSGEPWVVWVVDDDSDPNTSEDRLLLYSRLNRGRWTTPAECPGSEGLPGVLMPNLALSTSTDGVLTFTAREVLADGSVAGEGNKDIVYTSILRDRVFEPATPLPGPRCRKGGRVPGRWPLARFRNTNEAVVVFRSFDGLGPEGGDGEIALSTIDLRPGRGIWSPVRRLTQDASLDWEIAADVGTDGLIRTVHNRPDGTIPDGIAWSDGGVAGGGLGSGLVTGAIEWVPDLEVERVRVSDPHAAAGDQVEVTVVLRNAGLAWLERPDGPGVHNNVVLHYGWVEGDAFVEFRERPVEFWVGPDGRVEVRSTTLMPSALKTLRVIADRLAEESDVSNNAADVALGVMPPMNLRCADASDGSVRAVELSWENQELYESVLVFRDGRLTVELPGEATTFVDATSNPGEHEWSVRGRIGHAMSARGFQSCEFTIPPDSTTLFVRGDGNSDGGVDISDPVFTLAFLFTGGVPPTCRETCDANDDGGVDVSDPIFMLDFLFQGGEPIPAPYPACGAEVGAEDLGCTSYPPCE